MTKIIETMNVGFGRWGRGIMVTSVGISDKLGKRVGLTASCSSLDSWSCVRARVRWTVQAGHTERRTGGGRMLEATPSAGFREASVECAGGVEGVVGMMRASAGPAATRSTCTLWSCSTATRLGGNPPLPPSTPHTAVVVIVKKTFRLLDISTHRRVIIPKLSTRVVVSSSIRRDNRCRRLYYEKAYRYIDSQFINHIYRYRSSFSYWPEIF